MGLDITGMYSDKEYRHGYNALHCIRYLAVKCVGFEGDYAEFHKQQSGPNSRWEGNKFTEQEKKEWKPIWDQYPEFWQLLHFSDAGGMLVPNWVLRNVDIRESFNLGNLDEFVSELEKVKDVIAREPEKYNDKELSVWCIEPFFDLYDLAVDELEQVGVLKFH